MLPRNLLVIFYDFLCPACTLKQPIYLDELGSDLLFHFLYFHYLKPFEICSCHPLFLMNVVHAIMEFLFVLSYFLLCVAHFPRNLICGNSFKSVSSRENGHLLPLRSL